MSTCLNESRAWLDISTLLALNRATASRLTDADMVRLAANSRKRMTVARLIEPPLTCTPHEEQSSFLAQLPDIRQRHGQCIGVSSKPGGGMSRNRIAIGVAALAMLATGNARAQDAAAGARVFADQKCSMCHSI